MPLQLKWQYLQRTIPQVGALMGPIEKTLREKSLPTLAGGEETDTDFRKILGHSANHGGLGILYPWLSAESAYNTYKANSGELVGSLLGGIDLNYVRHRECVRKESAGVRKEQKHVEMVGMDRRKELAGGQ